MGRPRKVKIETTPSTNTCMIEPETSETKDDTTRMFPDWSFKSGEPIRKATVRTQTEFCISVVDGVDKNHKVAWGWQAVLDFAKKIEEMSDGHMRITLDIPPHIRLALENAK